MFLQCLPTVSTATHAFPIHCLLVSGAPSHLHTCEAREAAAVAPALLTLPSSERLRARVKAIGNRREALGDRDFLPLETRSFDELRLATALTGEP
mmetsp:Transcript_56124/g.116360  ORF Transcript_56124/g.116360 Transcript_56124/m.116360 type:complete len:95 (-) Transcript_56124:888-1172(-)